MAKSLWTENSVNNALLASGFASIFLNSSGMVKVARPRGKEVFAARGTGRNRATAFDRRPDAHRTDSKNSRKMIVRQEAWEMTGEERMRLSVSALLRRYRARCCLGRRDVSVARGRSM